MVESVTSLFHGPKCVCFEKQPHDRWVRFEIAALRKRQDPPKKSDVHKLTMNLDAADELLCEIVDLAVCACCDLLQGMAC